MHSYEYELSCTFNYLLNFSKVYSVVCMGEREAFLHCKGV